jgi:hypothetical protein
MDTIFRLIAFLGALFTLAMTVLMLFIFRKERRINAFSPFLSAVLSLVLLPIFVLLSGARLNLLLAVPILALGLLIGSLRGLTTQLYYQDGQVVGRDSRLTLLGWGGSLVLAQLLNLFGSAFLASLGLIPLLLSTGTQVGMNGNVFLRRLMMPPPPPVPLVNHARPGLPEPAGVSSPPPLPERMGAAALPPPGLPERPEPAGVSSPPSLPERMGATAPAPPDLPEGRREATPPGLPERE